MKRILYSCLFLTFIFLSDNIFAQAFNFAVTPSVQCYSAGGHTVVATITTTYSGPPPASSYTWAISSPTPVNTCSVGTAPIITVAGGTLATFVLPCCGQYTITCFPCDAVGIPIPGGQIAQYATIECPVTGTAGASSSSICAGNVATLTALGGVTWTWTPGNMNGSVVTVTPGANTCYTANGNTAAGCTVQATTCLTVQTIIVNITPPSQTVCAGTNVTLTANTTATPVSTGIVYQWEENPPGGTVIGNAQTQTVAPVATTVYSVNASVNTCSTSATNTITIAPFLSILASASSVSVCQTETVVLTATSSATSFTWTQITFPNQTAVGNPVTMVGPGIYVVDGTNGSCPGAPATVTVYLTSFQPTITAPASNFSICPGETFTLSAIGGVAGTYTWATLDASGQPLALVPPMGSGTVSTSQATTTAYGVAAMSPGGCQGSQTISVGTNPNVNVTAAASAASVCASSPVTLTASGATLYTFVSSAGGGTTLSPSSTTSVIVVNPSSNTTYSIYGTTASGYCQGMTTLTVNMITGGSLTLTTTSSAGVICPGQSSSLTASGALSYTWAGPALTNTTGASTIASPTLAGVNVYTVTGDNNGGCFGMATVNVTVSAIPSITVGATAAAICAGYTSTLSASGAASYTWTGSTFAIPINQPSISVSPGTYTVIGGSAGANCPSVPVYSTIVLSPPLVITTSISPIQGTTCIEQNYPYKLSKPVNLFAFGASSYVWIPYNPAYVTYSLGPQTTVRPPTSTCYTVTGSTSVCSGTAQICVTVNQQFTFAVTPPLPAICLGDSMKLTISQINAGTPTLALPPYTYEWRDPQGPSMTSPNTSTNQVFPQSTDTYTVEVKDSRGCISMPRLITVTVLPQPMTAISIPTINNVPTNTVCFVGDRPSAPDNKIDLLAYNTNVGLPPGVSQTYTWQSPYVPSSIVTPSNNAGVTVTAPRRTPYVVIYTVTTGYNGIQGCTRKDTVSIRVIDCRPVTQSSITFVMDIDKNDTLCARDCITYLATTDTLAGGPQTYSWTFEGGLPLHSTDKSPTVCYDLPSDKGGWSVVLRVSNPYPVYETPPGSSAVVSFYKYIKVVDIPNVTIVPPGQQRSDTTIKFSQSIVLTATNALTYTWTPRYSISGTTGSVVTVNPTKTTQYIVTGKNSARCFSRDTINVIVIEDCGDMFVPNAFSPNGDEINDVLRVRGVCLETLTFLIFNRWGEKVFETNDVNVGWDGTYHGEKLNTGVFVYRLEGKTYEGKGFSSKGNITLIR
ncbi:MAG: gliding motility-associated C-terminal domain-containing protein [Bacteroidota bacterium]